MEIDVEAEVKSAVPRMVAQLRENLSSKIQQHAESVAVQACGEAVKKWTQEVIIPEIIAQLATNQQAMINKAKGIADVLGDGFAAALKLKIEESLKSSYNVSEIVGRLLNGY